MLRARITGVVVLAFLVGASGAGAQTPTPDPAPLPPPPAPPVVEPAPTPEPTPSEPAVSEQDPAPKPKPKPKHKQKEQPAAVVQTTAHPTLAEKVPSFLNSRASASKASVVPVSAPIVAATGSHGSPVVLILVFILGSASLLVVLFKDVSVERLDTVPLILTEHRGEVMYIGSALLLGVGIGLFAAFSLQ